MSSVYAIDAVLFPRVKGMKKKGVRQREELEKPSLTARFEISITYNRHHRRSRWRVRIYTERESGRTVLVIHIRTHVPMKKKMHRPSQKMHCSRALCLVYYAYRYPPTRL